MKVTNAKDSAGENIKNTEITEENLVGSKTFRVRSRKLGVKEGLNYNKISELIEQIEELEKLETGKRKL
jgi:hypothetical protein